METKNKVAFVTGGGTGIGKTIALTLAKAGYDIAVTYYGSAAGAAEVCKDAESMGRKAVAFRANLGNYDEIISVFESLNKEFGRLDVFINNAGLTEKAKFIDTTEEMFDKVCNLDYKGAFFCVQQAAKSMIAADTKGSIIMISSNNAFAHFADVAVYGSVKAATVKLAEHAAIELAQYGIRVNTIAPGWTDTGASRLDAKEDTYYKIPLKKWASPQEIADAAVFLSSPSAVSITGITMVIDNGALLVSDKRERYGY